MCLTPERQVSTGLSAFVVKFKMWLALHFMPTKRKHPVFFLSKLAVGK